jgi:FkbM family methyltransferase
MAHDAVDLVARVVRAGPRLRGQGRLAHVLFEHGARTGSWDVAMRGGYRMVVPRSSRQGWSAAFTGCYDEDTFELARHYVRPGSTVLDVGASLGFWTMMLARRTDAALVVAFEPLAGNRAVIERNVASNGLGDRVRVEPYGLGEEATELTAVAEAGGVGNAGVLGADAPEHADLPERVTMQLRPLDAMAPLEAPCSFVKIDVEGFELPALRGAERFVATHRPTILGEFSTIWSTERGDSDTAVEEWAEAHAYDVCEVRSTRRGWLRPSASELGSFTSGPERSGSDLLLVPSERSDAGEGT